jgi:uncharacterized protein (DUF1330 family)
MPKAYVVPTYTSISDPQKLANYGKLAIPAVAPFGARMLARGAAAAAYENGVPWRCGVPLGGFGHGKSYQTPSNCKVPAEA